MHSGQILKYMKRHLFLHTAPDYIASLLTPTSDIPSRSFITAFIQYLWLIKNELKDWWQGLLCCHTPCLESAANRLETLAFDCFIQEQTEEFSVSCCLHWEHCVNSGMCHRSDCRGRSTSHCCYCYCYTDAVWDAFEDCSVLPCILTIALWQ